MPNTALVLLTDARGLALTEHAAAVALLTQRSTRHIIVFCVDPLPSRTRLQSEAQKRGFTLEYRPLGDVNRLRTGYVAIGAHSHVTSAALLKMAALDALSGEFDRALYVDGDVLLMKDFDLAHLDFDGATVAAVYDIARSGSMATEHDFFERCATYGRSPHYFNSGVIAVDFARWSDDSVRRYDEALARHAEGCDYKIDCSCDDQCAWNRAFERTWKRLPLTFNLQACALFSDHWTGAVARHYVGPAKFLPFKAWRNDRQDRAVLNEARKILDLPPVGFPLASLARALNKVRNREFVKASDTAIARIERMYHEVM